MAIFKLILKFIFGASFIAVGVLHFTSEEKFMKIMPDYIPVELHRPAVIVSGIAEILLGALLLIPKTQRLAAWGLIALLIAVFPANLHMYQHPDRYPELSPRALLIRLPLQAVMILLAYWFTRPIAPKIGYAPTTEI
jgi:uncharacterized membrane protein